MLNWLLKLFFCHRCRLRRLSCENVFHASSFFCRCEQSVNYYEWANIKYLCIGVSYNTSFSICKHQTAHTRLFCMCSVPDFKMTSWFSFKPFFALAHFFNITLHFTVMSMECWKVSFSQLIANTILALSTPECTYTA